MCGVPYIPETLRTVNVIMPASFQLRLLFVCLGNICRSPAAEIVCRAALNKAGLAERVMVDSCGTASYHVGSKPDARMLAALQRAGYSYGGHRGRQLRKSDGESFDLIIPQDEENLDDVQRLLRGCKAQIRPMSVWFPQESELREVPDPYYGDSADFDSVVLLLEQSMPQLMAYVNERLSE